MFWITLGGPVLFMATALILGAIEPDYNAIDDEISYLALGQNGTWQTLNFLVAGGLTLLLGVRVSRFQNPPIASAKYAVAAILLMGVVFIGAGIFPTDPEGADPLTLVGVLHLLDFVVGIVGIITLLFIVGRKNRGTGYGKYTLASGAVALISFLLVMSVDDISGLAQRILLTAIIGWIIVTALRLKRDVTPSVL